MAADPKPKRRKRKAPPGRISNKVRQQVWDRCTIEGIRVCEVPVRHECTGRATELSHIVAASRGGRATVDNLHAACRNGARAEEKKQPRNWRAGKAYGHRSED